MLEGLDAAINSLVFLGAAVIFLVTVERRIVRHRILSAIEELRELAHIIDMHQLTKAPEVLAAIDNVDDLTTRLALKIWQKIAILNAEQGA